MNIIPFIVVLTIAGCFYFVIWSYTSLVRTLSDYNKFLKKISDKYFVFHALMCRGLLAKLDMSTLLENYEGPPSLNQTELFLFLSIADDVSDGKAHYDFDTNTFGYEYQDRDNYISPKVDWI